MPKKPNKLRDQDRPTVLGYELDKTSLTPCRKFVIPVDGKDYGCDPLGDGTFRMVPSGDVVDWEERCRRLGDPTLGK